MPNIMINDLPPEILGLIFMSFHRDLKRGEVDIGLAAVCLTCKRWSDLALSIPEFWSCIDIISNPIQSAVPISNLLSYTKVFSWLDRSKNWPLALAVTGEGLDERQFASLKAIFLLLIAHSHRWRRVSFRFGFWLRPMHVYLPHTFIAPILENLEMICDSNDDGSYVFYERMLRGSPALQSYTHRGPYHIHSLPSDLPWKQLRNLEVTDPTNAMNALIWLGKAINLHSYYIVIGPDDIRGQSLKPVTSPIELLTMKIERGTRGLAHNAKEFFRFIDAKDLKNLSIHFVLGHSMVYDILSYILSKPRLLLSSLTITNLATSEVEFLDCLKLLSDSSITTFEILTQLEVPVYGYCEPVKNEILNLLTFHGDGSPKTLCPLLETLTLELCVGADDGLLTNMVRSRRRSPDTLRDHGIACLKRLDVVFFRSTHSLDEEGLKEIYGEGLRGCVKFK